VITRSDHHTIRFGALGGEAEITVSGMEEERAHEGAAAAQADILRIEAKYSRYRDDSVTSRINRAAGGAPIEVDEETGALLDYGEAAFRQSSGLFDLTSGVLRRVWNFRAGRVPTPDEVERVLPLIGWEQVEWRRPFIRLPQVGMELDFGGFGKEYAADRAAGILAGFGVKHGYVNLGGDLRVVGAQPGGAPWRIGLRHPRDAGGVVTTLEVSSGGLATSGDYERYMDVNGRRYCHILNPRTGWPIDSTHGDGVQAVTILAPTCITAGTVATTVMLKGVAAGRKLLRHWGVPFCLVTSSGHLESRGLAP